MPENRPALAMPQSLRPCGAPPFTQGRLCDGRRVRPYIHLPIVIAYLKLFVGGRPRRPVQPCVIANLWFPVGADSISARAISHNRPIARRGQDPSLRTDVNIIQRPKLQSRKIPGASGTPPPTSNHASGVGANIVRPCSWLAMLDSAGGYGIRPYELPKSRNKQ